jgi:hypothetical protein
VPKFVSLYSLYIRLVLCMSAYELALTTVRRRSRISSFRFCVVSYTVFGLCALSCLACLRYHVWLVCVIMFGLFALSCLACVRYHVWLVCVIMFCVRASLIFCDSADLCFHDCMASYTVLTLCVCLFDQCMKCLRACFDCCAISWFCV